MRSSLTVRALRGGGGGGGLYIHVFVTVAPWRSFYNSMSIILIAGCLSLYKHYDYCQLSYLSNPVLSFYSCLRNVYIY